MNRWRGRGDARPGMCLCQNRLGSSPVSQLFSAEQLVKIHDLETGGCEFANNGSALDYGYTASIVWRNHFVKEWGVTGIVRNAQEDLFAIVISKVPAHYFYKY